MNDFSHLRAGHASSRIVGPSISSLPANLPVLVATQPVDAQWETSESEAVAPSFDWMPLLNAIGTPRFETALKRFLAEIAGPGGCAVFFHQALGLVSSDCRSARSGNCIHRDRALGAGMGPAPQWVHFDDGPWHAAIAIRRACDSAASTTEEDSALMAAARALGAMLRKHLELVGCEFETGEPLSSLRAIEQCLADSAPLPPREVEVCSRVLFGLSSSAIALDLDLCETTVKTYRKRAYQRLSIGSERELLVWYLRKWARWISWHAKQAA